MATDLPAYLENSPDVLCDIAEPCPVCGSKMIGRYEAATNAVYNEQCTNCDYRED